MMGWLNLIVWICIFIVGSIVGSFLTVVIYRLPKKISFVGGRSFCPHCRGKIAGIHNIPLFSYFQLKGGCPNCEEKISMRYPLIELFTGMMALLIFFRYGLSFQWLVVFAVAAILITITMIDFDTMIIPNGLVLALGVPVLFSFFVFPELNLLSRVTGMFVVSLPMLVLTLFITDAFGGGDIKLIGAAGFMLGWTGTLLAAGLAIFLGGGVAVFLLLKKSKDKHMPFGPYLCVGILTSQLFGDKIIQGYFNILRL